MEKEFEEYWSAHSKRMLLNAPRNLRQEYLDSTKLDTPMDWVCYILPVAAGILVQPHVNLKSEVMSWAIILFGSGGTVCAFADGEAFFSEKEVNHSGNRAD